VLAEIVDAGGLIVAAAGLAFTIGKHRRDEAAALLLAMVCGAALGMPAWPPPPPTEEHWWAKADALTALATGLLVVVGLFQLWLFYVQLRYIRQSLADTKAAADAAMVSADAAKKSADVAEVAMVAGERAFVFATDLFCVWDPLPVGGPYNWRFRPVFRNSGDTPVKQLRICVESTLRTSPLPPGFNFNQNPPVVGTGILGPNSSLTGVVAPRPPAPAITPQDIVDIKNGQKYLYLWGWAKYYDVFTGTPEHITHFCWQITPVGDPFTHQPTQLLGQGSNLGFPYVQHVEGNCADEECA